METKIIDGKEYTKVGITEFSINGENKENSFTSSDLDTEGQISFNIKINSNTDVNPDSFTTSSLDIKNPGLNNNIKIVSEPVAKTSIDISNPTEDSTDSVDVSAKDYTNTDIKKNKINSWYYIILATGLLGFLYFIFIK